MDKKVEEHWLSAFPKDTTSELAGFVFTLSFMLSAKQEAMNTNFLKSFGMTRPGIELRAYRLGGERSTTRPTTGFNNHIHKNRKPLFRPKN